MALLKIYREFYGKDIHIDETTNYDDKDLKSMISLVYLAEKAGIIFYNMEYEYGRANDNLYSQDIHFDVLLQCRDGEYESGKIAEGSYKKIKKIKDVLNNIKSPLNLQEKVIAAALYDYYYEMNLSGKYLEFIPNPNKEDSLDMYKKYFNLEEHDEQYQEQQYNFGKKFSEEYKKKQNLADEPNV